MFSSLPNRFLALGNAATRYSRVVGSRSSTEHLNFLYHVNLQVSHTLLQLDLASGWQQRLIPRFQTLGLKDSLAKYSTCAAMVQVLPLEELLGEGVHFAALLSHDGGEP